MAPWKLRRQLVTWFVISLLASACTGDRERDTDARHPDSALALREVTAVGAPAQPSDDRGAPRSVASLRAAYIASVQADASEAYAFGATAVAVNAAHGLWLDLSEGTLQLHHQDDWQLDLRLRSVGRRGHLEAVAPAEAEPSGAPNRIAHRHGRDLRAWYVNGPLGVEQGFDILTRPLGEGQLTLVLDVRGATAEIADDDGEVALKSDNRPVAHYSDLFAYDADGVRLPAELEASGHTIRLHVDDDNARYPVVVDPLVWVERGNWHAGDGEASDYFGAAVAIDGDTAVVGAWGDDDNGSQAGAAYVYERNGSTFVELGKLLAFDGLAGDLFGDAVDIDGDRIVVGAPARDDNGSNSGAIYLFERIAGVWTAVFRFNATDAAANLRYGSSVAIDGMHILSGSPSHDFSRGAVYHLIDDQGSWVGHTLIASDAGSGDWFGDSVSLNGSYALIGARGNNDGGPNSGSAYVFYRAGLVLNQQQKLLAGDGAAQDYFGFSVDLSGSTAIVGAWADDDNGGDSGSAYVFTRSGSSWSFEQKLLPTDGASGDEFGADVAISGDTAIIGAPADDDDGSNSGSAYVFTRAASVWTQSQKLVASDAAPDDTLGNPLAISGTTALLAADHNDDLGNNSGSVYFFPLLDLLDEGATCASALDCASGFCVDDVCCDVACGGGVTTDCQACSVAMGGSTDGLCEAIADNTGCDDDDSCTQTDSCQTGSCVGANPVVCVALDACHDVGTCDPVTGTCDDPNQPNGTACDDGDLCTQSDTCELGICLGADPVSCPAEDQCHPASTCDPANGICDSPVSPDDTPCDDGDLCTEPDSCQSGQCVSAPVVCTAPDECHEAGVCDSASGNCDGPAKPDGTACSVGECQEGVCQTPSSSSSGTGGTGGAGGTAGAGGSATGGTANGGDSKDDSSEGGCGCRLGRAANSPPWGATLLALALGLVSRRRRYFPPKPWVGSVRGAP